MGTWVGHRCILLLWPRGRSAGIFLAKKDMDEIAAGRAPQLDLGWAKAAFYLNIVALVLFVLGICMWWGIGGLHRF